MIEYKKNKISLNRLSDILTVEDSEQSIDDKVTLNRIEEIRFSNVFFKYKDEFAIENLSLTVRTGKYYGIIGENGSGKTTFIKLLLHLYNCDSGDITINNTSYDKLSFPIIRANRQMVYIEDNPVTLFDDFDKNIILDSGKNTPHFTQTLNSSGLNEQYDTFVTKSAEELSAGQKQRVSLARGFYHLKNETILVLDEPFSALDANAISLIQDSIKRYKDKYHLTIFEITHNLSSMDRFDHIYYFENGKVLIEGTHKELMENENYVRYIQNYQSSHPVK